MNHPIPAQTYVLGLVLAGLAVLPLAAQESMTVRQPPPPLVDEPLTGEAKLHPTAKFGFGADVAGVIQVGDWRVSGVVTETAPERITFRTGDGEAGHLVYRLPGKRSLPLASGDALEIVRDHEMIGKRLAYELHISSGDTLILATSRGVRHSAPQDENSAEIVLSGRAPGEKPAHVVFFWSHPEDHELHAETDSAKHFTAPVSLKHEDGSMAADSLRHGESAVITLGGQEYLFMVLSSLVLESKVGDDEMLRDRGHMLEYVLVKI